MARKLPVPCKTCPWRVGNDATTIPGYLHDQAVALLDTVGEGDDFRPVMACHRSTNDKTFICNGYLSQAGFSNINVRMMLARGRCPSPLAVLDACESRGIELEPDYLTVLEKLEKSLPEARE